MLSEFSHRCLNLQFSLQHVWCCRVNVYPELSLCLSDADADMVAMGTYDCTHSAHTQCTLPAVDTVHLMVLLAFPERNVLHGRNQGVTLKHRGVQVGTQMLCTHGGPAHQTGLHSRLIYCFRAIMAGHRPGFFAF